MRNRWVEAAVGIFIIAAMLGLIALAFKVSGLTQLGDNNFYVLKANFDNVGDLKVRAPVTVSGVTVGRVSHIELNPDTFRAVVTLQINHDFNQLPIDTSASILTQGLLGSNYISLTPGFESATLQTGQQIETTHSAIVLENLIGQLMFNLTGDKKKKDDQSNSSVN